MENNTSQGPKTKKKKVEESAGVGGGHKLALMLDTPKARGVRRAKPCHMMLLLCCFLDLGFKEEG